MMAPCKDCEKRTLGCHSSCGDYANFKKELEEIHKKEKEYASGRNYQIGKVIDTTLKHKKGDLKTCKIFKSTKK